MCCFVIFTWLKLHKYDFNVCKNIDFQWNTYTIADYNGEPGNIPNIFDPYLFRDLIKRQLALRTYDEIEIDLFILETSMQYGS